ncbi:MAG: O-antigen ligase family protein [Nitrospinae bacterium]|nr:O-antigen ligase family protein [Nitrospinota bacterium]
MNAEFSRWDKAGWIFLFTFAAASLFSISVAQIAATGLGVTWIGRHIAARQWPDFSPLAWPFAAFIIASLIAALLSLDDRESVKDSKDLTHIVIYFAAYDLLTRGFAPAGALLRTVAACGFAAALVGFGQAARKGIDLYDRISGAQGMYMTYAGLLMLALVIGLCVALFSRQKHGWWLWPAVAAMAFAIVLSLTRNALIGALAGSVVAIGLWRPKALIAAPVLLAIALALAPATARERAMSVFDLENRSNKERLYVWGAGIKIAADHPLFGVGQNSFPLVYPNYRHPDVTEPDISHLHNNVLEIAAERGLIGLAAWLYIWIAALVVMIRGWRALAPGHSNERAALAAGFAGMAAFHSAGMFEYNFGDSEIQMLMYLLLALAAAAAGKNSLADGAGRG